MNDLETICLDNLDFTPLFYFRYVDDILTCIPRDKLHHVLDIFNSYNNRLKFTYEIEHDNALNFLEITLIKDTNNKLITNSYHKPTFSARFLNYNSTHPLYQKRALIYSLLDRTINLSHKISP